MAHTEDIAEKVAGLLLDQTARAANFTIDTGTTLVKGAGVLTRQSLEKLTKQSKKNKEMEMLSKIEGEVSALQLNEFAKHLGLASSTVRVATSDVKDYETLLRQNGVMYAKADVKDDDAKLFIFLTQDQDKIQNVYEVLNANRGRLTEVKPDLYIKNLAPENVRVVDGLDPVEMELFRQYARYEGLLFTALQRQDKYALVYSAEDEKKARNALLHVSWDLTGYNGARNREQVMYRLMGRSAAMISAEEGRRELYIVSRENPGNFVEITSEDYAVYKNNKKVSSVARGTPDFFTRCMAAIDGIASAVVLDEQAFHHGMTPEELEGYHTLDLHARDYDMLLEMNEQNSLINLAIMKSGLDDEHNATWGLSDPSVSYSDFASYEYIMDDEEREARAVSFEHFRDAAFYGEGRYTVQDIHLDEKNVDYIIAKAEAKQKGFNQSTPQRAHTPTTEKEQGQSI